MDGKNKLSTKLTLETIIMVWFFACRIYKIKLSNIKYKWPQSCNVVCQFEPAIYDNIKIKSNKIDDGTPPEA